MNCHRGLRRCWSLQFARQTHGCQSSGRRFDITKAIYCREKSSMPMQHPAAAAAAALAKRTSQEQQQQNGPTSTTMNSSRQEENDTTTTTTTTTTTATATVEQQPPPPSTPYSVQRRVLPSSLTALSSPAGRKLLIEALVKDTTESYFCLTEHFVNQSDPAYCGVTTLLMVLNAMNMDPQVRWKGGWRYYGDEDVLLHGCCFDREQIRRVGITMDQFRILGTCHGVTIHMKNALVEDQVTTTNNNDNDNDNDFSAYTLQDFRLDIMETLCHPNFSQDDDHRESRGQILVVSFDRSTLGQTGSGHFSPLAAYHESTDQVLLLDVARFKYSPYWVSVSDLYDSMKPFDQVSQQPRGWFVMKPPSLRKHYGEYNQILVEDRRPAHLVPKAQDDAVCPMSKIKVAFCKAAISPEKP